MPLLRSTPASLSRSGPIRATSIRGRILALLDEPGVREAVHASPITIADLASSIPAPEGKSPEQWKKEIGSVVAVDLKKDGALSRALVRVSPGRFGIQGLSVAATSEESDDE